MDLLKQTIENAFYSFRLKENRETKILNFQVSFEFTWNLIEPNEELPYKMSFFSAGEEKPFPYDMKEDFNSIPLHIPNQLGRDMFKLIIDAVIKRTSSPIAVTVNAHPGYPLTVVTFNKTIMAIKDVKNLIEIIMAAISRAEITEEAIQRETGREEMDDDEIDENVILDYEEDSELRELIKKPPITEYLPLKGE